MQLLISVINEHEAKIAVDGGADIIDVKNPHEGSLGANSPEVIKCIRNVVPQGIPVSAAIGDAPDLPGLMSLAALGAAACDVQYIKVGLYGVNSKERAVNLLMEIKKSVKGYNRNIRIIAVAYGDAHKINAISPLECPKAAVEAGIDGCMLDTIVKGEGDLFSSVSVGNINMFLKECKNHNLISALAGSLVIEHIPILKELGPDIIGFRGAVCSGDRVNGAINDEAVKSIKDLM
ncbi:MAG: (5-formylfuran-3-yl)methyl phosphate synthase [Desulfobacteraceae bacterium]|jgi:uncharacterized protein (UPF0264 family)